jgi:flagellar motor switch protein FliN/FliY
MSFSTSPLVPDQRTGDDSWDGVAETTVAAVKVALPQIPTAAPLTPGTPLSETSAATLPDPAGAAITALLAGGVEGSMLIVVGQELVDALAGTPFGALEPAKALRPALDAIAVALGGRLEGEPAPVPADEALEFLAGGTCVMVPLNSEEGLSALVGFSFTQNPSPGVAAAAALNAASAARSWGIEMLRDVEMEVTCELGRTRMTVRQLLALAPGDVVELDRLAGSPADLLVNGTLLARGEVVVVDESFGLRITEIVTRDAT